MGVAVIAFRLRSWWRAHLRTVTALAMAVALVGGLALTLLAGAVRTSTAPARYTSAHPSSYDVSVSQNDGPPATTELEALPSVDDVAAASFVFGGLAAESGPDINALLFAGSLDALSTTVVEGRAPAPDAPGEFVASPGLVDAAGLELGDHLQLVTLTAAQAAAGGFDAGEPQGVHLEATLVGILGSDSGLAEGYDVAVASAGLLDATPAGSVGIAATMYTVRLAPGSTTDDFRSQLTTIDAGAQMSVDEIAVVPGVVRTAVRTQAQGLFVLAAIVGLTALAVLGQTLTRQLRIPDAEVETLGALGADRRMAMVDAAGRAVLPTVLGGIGAVVIAYLASSRFPIDFVRDLEPDPGHRFETVALLPAFAVLVSALIAWVAFAQYRSGRPAPPTVRSSIADRLAERAGGPRLDVAMRFAFGQHPDQRRGANIPLLGLVAVFVVLGAALTFGANLVRLVDTPRQYGINFDLAIGSGGDSLSPQVVDGLDKSSDVAALTLYGVAFVSVADSTVTFDAVGMQPVRGDLLPDVLEGRLPATVDDIALGRSTSRALHAGVGDQVTLATADGDRAFKVSGIAVVPSVEGADGVGHDAVVTDAALAVLDPDVAMSAGAVRLRPTAGHEGLLRVLAITGTDESAIAGQEGGAIGADRPPDILNLYRVRTVPAMVAASVGALAVLSLAHLVMVSVRRRRRDHAVLQALGASPGWIGTTVYLQATLLAAGMLAVGLPVGDAVGRILYGRIVSDLGARTDTVDPTAALGVTVLAALVLADAAAVLPALLARRRPPAALLTRD